jgi:hypothetical protein
MVSLYTPLFFGWTISLIFKFNETHSREELKIIFSGLRISESLFLVHVTCSLRDFSVFVKSLGKKVTIPSYDKTVPVSPFHQKMILDCRFYEILQNNYVKSF